MNITVFLGDDFDWEFFFNVQNNTIFFRIFNWLVVRGIFEVFEMKTCSMNEALFDNKVR